jgi:hypothetical protein
LHAILYLGHTWGTYQINRSSEWIKFKQIVYYTLFVNILYKWNLYGAQNSGIYKEGLIMNTYQTINDDELKDFRNICSDQGYNPDKFNFNEHSVTKPNTTVPVYSYGKVTISRKGRSKTYETGHGSSWHADFDHDLRNNFFV